MSTHVKLHWLRRNVAEALDFAERTRGENSDELLPLFMVTRPDGDFFNLNIAEAIMLRDALASLIDEAFADMERKER